MKDKPNMDIKQLLVKHNKQKKKFQGTLQVDMKKIRTAHEMGEQKIRKENVKIQKNIREIQRMLNMIADKKIKRELTNEVSVKKEILDNELEEDVIDTKSKKETKTKKKEMMKTKMFKKQFFNIDEKDEDLASIIFTCKNVLDSTNKINTSLETIKKTYDETERVKKVAVMSIDSLLNDVCTYINGQKESGNSFFYDVLYKNLD